MTKTTEINAPAEMIVTMDRRREERRENNSEETTQTAAPVRRKAQRRRQIDPTTCERDYSNDEIEFMQAMDTYKRTAGRMFPTCSEILEVLRSMGYVRLNEEQQALLFGDVDAEFNGADAYLAESDEEEDDFDTVDSEL
ncbi:hypothetical protein SH139x_000484 [Planctomycetaceae bacterium SH139]